MNKMAIRRNWIRSIAAMILAFACASSGALARPTSRDVVFTQSPQVILVLNWNKCGDCLALKQLFEDAKALHPNITFKLDVPNGDFNPESMPLVLVLNSDGTYRAFEKVEPKQVDGIIDVAH